MTDNASLFLEALVHQQHKVYGYKLRPLSLLHLALLDKFVPDVVNRSITRDTLPLAALICSCRTLADFYKKLKSWRAYVVPFYRYATQEKSFLLYLEDHLTLPETTDSPASEKVNPFPFALLFAAKLIKQTGYPWTTVFEDMSISHVFWLVSCMDYMETGETAIVSDKEKLIYETIASLTPER